jgi:hypothetical protein
MRVGYDQRNDDTGAAERQQLGAVARWFERIAEQLPADEDGLPLEQFPAPLLQLLQDHGDLDDRLRLAVTNFDPQSRQGVLKTLEAFIQFAGPRFGDWLAPLMHLENALRHLDDNVVMPMLKPTPRPGAQYLTQAELQRHGVVAAAIDLIRQSSHGSLPRAAAEVVGIARNGRPLPSATVVLQWRKNALKAPRDRPDAVTYRQLLAEARERLHSGGWGDTQLRDYAAKLLLEPWP